jgi:hypothetical protein
MRITLRDPVGFNWIIRNLLISSRLMLTSLFLNFSCCQQINLTLNPPPHHSSRYMKHVTIAEYVQVTKDSP